jgi:hypothetical protein
MNVLIFLKYARDVAIFYVKLFRVVNLCVRSDIYISACISYKYMYVFFDLRTESRLRFLGFLRFLNYADRTGQSFHRLVLFPL